LLRRTRQFILSNRSCLNSDKNPCYTLFTAKVLVEAGKCYVAARSTSAVRNHAISGAVQLKFAICRGLSTWT